MPEDLSQYKIRKTMFEREAQVTDPPEEEVKEEPQAESSNPNMMFFWVSVFCVVAGIAALTTGASLQFGIPVGVIVLGTLLLMLGILLGMD